MFIERLSVCLGFAMAVVMSSTVAASGGELEDQLRAAAYKGDSAQIRVLLKKGASIDARDRKGETPLLIVTHNNYIDAAKVLINAGADVNAKDNIQDSPYLYAGARGRNEILAMILKHGADLKSINRYGGTALIPAAERGHVKTVQMLIKAGVDVNHVNNLRWTALLEAIILGNGGADHTEIVRLLIKGKADVNLADGKGITPLQHARQRGYKEIERILVQAGAR